MSNNEYNGCLELTTNMGCANDCAYCPQKILMNKYYQNDKKRKSAISLDEFKFICKQLPKHIVINFGGMSEPFCNPECTDMILYANSIGRKIRVNTTLRFVSLENLEKIKNIEFTTFCVHTPDQDRVQKQEVTKEYLNKINIVKNFKNVYFMTIGRPDEEIEETLGQKISSTKIVLRGNNLNKNEIPPQCELSELDFKEIDGPIICQRTFEHNVKRPAQNLRPLMLSDGTVVLCCVDYGMAHILGNIFEQNFNQIINGAPMRAIEKKCLSGDTESILCRKCEWAISFNKDKWINYKKTGVYELPEQVPLLEMPFSIKNKVKNGVKFKIITILGIKFKFNMQKWFPDKSRGGGEIQYNLFAGCFA